VKHRLFEREVDVRLIDDDVFATVEQATDVRFLAEDTGRIVRVTQEDDLTRSCDQSLDVKRHLVE